MNGPYARAEAIILRDAPQCAAESGSGLASPRDFRRRPDRGDG